MSTGFLLHHTVAMPEFNWADGRGLVERQAVLGNLREQYLHNFDALKYLSRQRCRPTPNYGHGEMRCPHRLSPKLEEG
ncbi:unnamed protein product [Gongylonema pulchrum]|uniref:Heme peroxidase n=1 Tax=Gongylonema pulchrum TaxID=637853 RepID=A0A183ELZ0_9BILA|nr:unnamed protein product [Gongylonema pulchrum]